VSLGLGYWLRFWVSLVISSSILQVSFGAECDLLLTRESMGVAVKEQVLSSINAQENKINRLALRTLRSRISNSVLDQCLKQETCSRAQIDKIVQVKVDEALGRVLAIRGRMTLARGYALIISSMVGSAMLNNFLKAEFQSGTAWGWIAELSVPLTVIGILKFGAPLWDKLSAISTSAAFRIREGKSWRRTAPENEKLDTIYADMMSNFTPTQSIARTALANAVGTVRTVAKDSIEVWLKGDRERAADRMAELAIFSRKYLTEIHPSTGSMVRSIYMILVKHLGQESDRIEFSRLMLTSIGENDPDVELPGVHSYYDGLVKVWILENNGADTHH